MYSDDDSLDKLRRGLYSKKGVQRSHSNWQQPTRKSADEPTVDLQKDWQYKKDEATSQELENTHKEQEQKSKNIFRWFIIAPLAIFLIASGLAVYKLFFAGSIVSPKNISIDIDIPTTVRPGGEVSASLVIRNNNKVDLTDVKLIVTLPPSSLSADGTGERIDRVTRELGQIEAGASVREKVDFLLFGEDDEDLELLFTLEYNTKNSDIRLENKEARVVRIGTSSVIMRVSPSVRSVQSGDEFEITIEVMSNSNSSIKDLVVEAVYPGGFMFLSSNPSPISGDSIWSIGDLEARESKSITLKGFIEGLDKESKSFAFNTGVRGKDNKIGRLYASSREPISLILPPISLTSTINKSSAQVVNVSPGESVSIKIDWNNTLSNYLHDLSIEAGINESYIEPQKIRAFDGFYRSATQEVVWNQATNDLFQRVSGGARGTVRFEFDLKGLDKLSGLSNMEIPLKIRAYASEPQSSNPERELKNEITRIIKLTTSLNITQTLYHKSGKFDNYGPVPPRAEDETSYTVVWRANNSGSDAKNVTVRAALPAYVKFVAAEEGAAISYQPLTNEIVWSIGDLGVSSVSTGRNATASFQVEMLPSRSQIGTSPTIIRDATIEGRDAFTGSSIRGISKEITTADLAEEGAGVVR